jgi:DNA-binding response OmpR family regulator
MPRILIIDDEPDARLVLRDILETEGYQVQEAANGAEALIQCRVAPVDLVITDIFMPKKDGLEFIVELRDRNALLPIIAVSGGGTRVNDGLQLAPKLGATAILPKPFKAVEILGAVKSALRPARPAPQPQPQPDPQPQ